MKLRYYLRGLAVGILLTTMILAIANIGNKPLTDAQIRQRALELGMIEADSQKLSSLKGEGGQAGAQPESTEPTGSVQPESQEPTSSVQPESQEPTNSDQPESTEPSKGGEQSESNTSTQSAGQPESSAPSVASTPVESDNEEEPSGGDTTAAVTLIISGGDSSYSVSRKLAAAGIVEDAAAFDAFLCDNGYSRTIHTGTYEILPGTSHEEIAKMIAG